MKIFDSLQRRKPQQIDMVVKKHGRRTLDWLNDPEGEARRIWNAVRRTQSIPASALSSKKQLREFLGEKNVGMQFLIDNYGFYSKVVSLEKDVVSDRVDEIRDARSLELLKMRLITKTLEEIRQELPIKYSTNQYINRGKKRVYIRDKKTGRFVTNFKSSRKKE